jgi:hypothetical protein
VIENVMKQGHTCSCFTRVVLMPSFFASVLIACSITADWLIPRLSASCLSNVCAVSLNRILVFFCAMLPGYHKIWYNTRTWKPLRYRRGVPVVASSARKNACGAESAGLSNQVKLLCDEASTEVWLSRFTTF